MVKTSVYAPGDELWSMGQFEVSNNWSDQLLVTWEADMWERKVNWSNNVDHYFNWRIITPGEVANDPPAVEEVSRVGIQWYDAAVTVTVYWWNPNKDAFGNTIGWTVWNSLHDDHSYHQPSNPGPGGN